LLSVTDPIVPVPDDRVIVTVEPPAVRLLPFASLACTVSTCVLVPFAVMLALVGVSVEIAASAAPGSYVIVDCVWLPPPLFTADPLIVATNTPLPGLVGDVTVGGSAPLLLSVTDPIVPVPDVFVIVTVAPPVVMLLPVAS